MNTQSSDHKWCLILRWLKRWICPDDVVDEYYENDFSLLMIVVDVCDNQRKVLEPSQCCYVETTSEREDPRICPFLVSSVWAAVEELSTPLV